MPHSLELELLQYVYQYYTVGLPKLIHANNYRGTDILKRIIADKINALAEKKILPIHNLIENVQRYRPDLIVEDWSFLQAPSYTFFIKLEEHIWKDLFITDTLITDISLLAPYYTTYICRNYSYPMFDKTQRGICFLESIDVGAKDLISYIGSLLNEYFASHRFISLFELSKIKISGGIPFGERHIPDSPVPVYNFLFNNIDRSNYEIYK